MRSSLLLCVGLLLAACAARAPELQLTQPLPAGEAPASVDLGQDAAVQAEIEVEQIAITPVAQQTVCRRERPTGSRIAVERCYVVAATAEGAAAQDAARQVMREEFELLRRQQMAEEQARQRAMQDRAMSDAARPQPSP